mgnify:CR=1 FL=1|jgi:glycosyltransferase involved in cell wall biosynthesis
MKIAFDFQIFSQQNYGGISRYNSILAEELSKLDQDVSIFTGIHRNNYLSSLPTGLVKGFKLSKYPPKTGRLFLKMNQHFTDYQMRQWKPNVIHETYYSASKNNLNNTPRVVTAHDTVHELFSKSFNKNDNITERKIIAFNRADHIISISHNTKKDLIDFFGINPEKITVIHHGVFPTLNNHHHLNETSGKAFILYVGPRGGYKNFNNFLKAVSISQKLVDEFDIVAFGGGCLSPCEQTLIYSLGFKKDQVRQVGGNDLILASLYQNATAFIYPSLYEGFGMPPLEAMTFQCPVISSNTSSMPEIVGEAGEYFNPAKVESIKVAIENVVFSPSRIKYLKEKGLERIGDFSWKKCAENTLSIYKDLIG